MAIHQRAFEEEIHWLERQFLDQIYGPPTAELQSLTDRIRRAISWLKRAAIISHEDRPPRFVDLWIAFNALYGRRHYGKGRSRSENSDFKDFIKLLGRFDAGRELLNQLMGKQQIQDLVRRLLQNKYLWNEFWEDNVKFESEKDEEFKQIERALGDGDPEMFFMPLFERLKVLRNQIFHGSASAVTRRNKDALDPGICLLKELVTAFVRLMIQNGSSVTWPLISYPGRETPQHPEHQ